MKKDTILIQGAEETEIEFLVKNLKKVKRIEIGKFIFFQGELENKNIVISKTKVGEINAASATTVAIMNFLPKIIINQGTAGGYGINIHKGDIVIAEEYMQINSFMTKNDKVQIELKEFLSDDEKANKFHLANNNLLEKVKTILPSITDSHIHCGIVGSGDVWNKNETIIKTLNEKYNILCEEMETAGVYRIANNFNIPVISIRIISNNEILQEEYEPNIAENIQKIIYELVEKIEL